MWGECPAPPEFTKVNINAIIDNAERPKDSITGRVRRLPIDCGHQYEMIVQGK